MRAQIVAGLCEISVAEQPTSSAAPCSVQYVKRLVEELTRLH